jgi:hypothetical protein
MLTLAGLAFLLGCLVVGTGTTENEPFGYRIEAVRDVVQKAEAGDEAALGNVLVFNDPIEVQERCTLPDFDKIVGVNSNVQRANSGTGRQGGLAIETLDSIISLDVVNRFFWQSIYGRSLMRPQLHPGDCRRASAMILDFGMKPHDLDPVGVDGEIGQRAYRHQQSGPFSVSHGLEGKQQEPYLQEADDCQQKTETPISPIGEVLLGCNDNWREFFDSNIGPLLGISLVFGFIIGVVGLFLFTNYDDFRPCWGCPGDRWR